MIPDFNSKGTLPKGIHESSLEEFELRFAYTIIRKRLFVGLSELINDLKRIGCKAIYIDGSYVTNKRIPGDVDVCWDDEGIEYPFIKLMMPILLSTDSKEFKQKYNCDVYSASCLLIGTKTYFIDYFQSDENNEPKGIIKINI